MFLPISGEIKFQLDGENVKGKWLLTDSFYRLYDAVKQEEEWDKRYEKAPFY